MKRKEFKKYKKIIEKSNLFSKTYYLKTYRDARLASETPLDHFVRTGLLEDRKPNENFDPVWYREHYEDIKKNDVIPFIHYCLFGQKEFRFSNEKQYKEYWKLKDEFDSSIYKNNYEDLQKLDDDFDFLWHYVCYGKKENRVIHKIEKKLSTINKPKNIDLHSIDDYELIKNSQEFDFDFYLNAYPDVKKNKFDPLEHFCKYGWKEGRKPNVKFETSFYLKNNPDVESTGINPLVHYILFGKEEGREISSQEHLKVLSVENIFLDTYKPSALNIEKKIDILIPVYNGYEFLDPLFNSIFKNTSLPYRLLICDDKSSDKRILPFLKSLQKQHNETEIVLVENQQNLGFIGSVNRLVEYIENHFVLLNTDTEVPSYWLERLMFPIFNMEKIATTTPFTNAGTICSFPVYLEDNEIMEGMNVEELDTYFKKVNFKKTYLEIPTGVGFCMGVNKDLVDKIGMFDTVFGKGYGEENDFCQRAIKEGYKNIHVTNLFVYHKHGGSFPSEEKKRLIEQNLKLLNKKHPSYSKDVEATVKRNELQYLREVLYFQIKTDRQYATLILDHALGGGANHYIDDDIQKRLKRDEVICLVRYDLTNNKKFICQFMTSSNRFLFSLDTLEELENTLAKFNFNELYLNSLVSYADISKTIQVILNLHTKQHFKLIIPIHDYFPLCPNYTLLNEKYEYCGVPDNSEVCRLCLKLNKGEFKMFEETTDIETWRIQWQRLFMICQDIVCFSNASKDIFIKAYPKYQSKVKVIPHDISGRFSSIYKENTSNKRVIGILGGINIPKGALIIKKLVEYIDLHQLDIKVVLVGEISISISSASFHKTGRYLPEHLPEIIKKFEITEFFIPSVWPETFSYTTDEIMQLGYPLTVFDIGAPAERVKNYKLGKVIEIGNIESILFSSKGCK